MAGRIASASGLILILFLIPCHAASNQRKHLVGGHHMLPRDGRIHHLPGAPE